MAFYEISPGAIVRNGFQSSLAGNYAAGDFHRLYVAEFSAALVRA